MKLVMTLLVLNEADVVVATDNGSTDGTIEILEEFQRDGLLHLRHDADDRFDQARLTTEMAWIARERFGADWVLSNDADEFWVGPLRAVLETTPANLLFCRRANRIAAAEAAWSFAAARHLAIAPRIEARAELLQPIQPKVLVRASDLVRLTQGCHNAEMRDARPAASREILIRHFPIRGRDHFVRKATAGGAAYARNRALDPRLGEHWRRWHSEILAGRPDEAYAAAVPSAAEIDMALAEGTLVADDRLLQSP